jgi:hypothetical protein
MDFIIEQPSSIGLTKSKDTILVIVDRFTKYAYYLETTEKINTGALATLFLERILL